MKGGKLSSMTGFTALSGGNSKPSQWLFRESSRSCVRLSRRHLVDDQPFLLGVHYYIRTLAQVLQLTALTVHTRRCVGTVGMKHGLDTSPTSMVLASPYVARSTVGAWFSTANAYTAPTAPFAVTPAALGGHVMLRSS